ncbi:MAG TPA: N-acetylglucosamine-6-phosphate deacetylase [Solirubrobacterales bacterium]|jgi:N-acetylglucosamine-6-phosphate deacetylase|nr:N-acetylglucosamine-6-phosphate deacetylase [Solirubrobacterales bacterium]
MRLGVGAAMVDGDLVDGDVEVVDGRIAAVGVRAPAGSKIAVPGFVDLQVNGYAGVDFSAAGEDGHEVAGAALLADGVTAFQPTIVTAEVEAMVDSVARVRQVEGGPQVIGVHLEGPFLSPVRPGAHDEAALRPPDLAVLAELLAAGRTTSEADGPAELRSPEDLLPTLTVSQVTLAPELPGAPELIDALVERGITVSCGHTDADASAAHLAFDRGASAVTHIFNAMRRPDARDPGIAFAALGRDDVFVTAIVDGHHLADDTVRTIWRAAGDRLVLISDAVAAAAAPDGDYTLGGNVPIHCEAGVVRNADGSLAGSTVSMLDAIRNLHTLGIPLAAALRAATEAPARMARRPDLGRIAPGACADLVVLDDSLELTQVLLAGKSVF